jgi:hypothetical protein
VQVVVQRQAAPLGEHRAEAVARRADRERRLVDDERAGADVRGDVAGCGVDRTEVDLPIRIDNDRHDHDHGIGLAESGWILPGGRTQAAGGHQLGNPIDERLLVPVRRLPTIQRVHDPLVHVDAEDVVAA